MKCVVARSSTTSARVFSPGTSLAEKLASSCVAHDSRHIQLCSFASFLSCWLFSSPIPPTLPLCRSHRRMISVTWQAG